MKSYRILFWLGGGVVLLLAAVLVLARLAPGRQGGPPPDPERTVIWLYNATDPSAPSQALVLEESRSEDRLALVAFAVPSDLEETFGGSRASRAQRELASRVERAIDHRVFIPYSVVVTLVDSARGVSVSGRDLTGAEAVAYIQGGGDLAPDRAGRVMLSLAEAVSRRGMDLNVSDGYRLARQVDTDLDLTAIPEVLARWSRYPNPVVRSVSGQDLKAVQRLLAPDRR